MPQVSNLESANRNDLVGAEMFTLIASFQRACSKTSRVKSTLLSVVVCMFWCAPAWSQDAPAGIRIESEAPSIHVSFGGPQPDHDDWYQVRMQNQSPHIVTEISDGVSAIGSAWNVSLITPGGAILRENNKGNYMLQAVLFDNGSYQGDQKIAAEMAALRVGEMIQWERVKRLVDEIVATNDSDETKLERMRAEVEKLPVTVEPAMIERLKSTYPSLPVIEKFSRDNLFNGLGDVRHSFIVGVELYQKNPGAHKSVAAWWANVAPTYEFPTSCDGPGLPAINSCEKYAGSK
jgi:hypothetical protein